MIRIDVERSLKSKIKGKLSEKDSVVVTLSGQDALSHDEDISPLFGWDRDTTARIPLERGSLSPLETRVVYQSLAGHTATQLTSWVEEDTSSIRFSDAQSVGVDGLVRGLQKHWTAKRPDEEFSEDRIGGLSEAREIFNRHTATKPRRIFRRSKQSIQT